LKFPLTKSLIFEYYLCRKYIELPVVQSKKNLKFWETTMADSRKEQTRTAWLETIEKHKLDADGPATDQIWSTKLECASRDELISIQNDKLKMVTPFLYENSDFYRRRFDRLDLAPTDIQTVDDLSKWPIVDKSEMMEDALEHPPYGTYSTMDDALWDKRGWMMFSSSGSSGVPRVFRYSHVDRDLWEWANARAIYSFGVRPDDTILLASGYGPHVFAWGVQYALQRMNVACIPGGGMTTDMRANIVDRFKPTVLCCTTSYALHLGRVMEEKGLDPAASSIRMLFVGGEPGTGILNTRNRLKDLWGAEMMEFYGCTEVSPHCGGYSCSHAEMPDGQIATHLMEDHQIWELVDPDTMDPVAEGERGITVCTSLNSESSPQLRFNVGDYTTYSTEQCGCGRTHVRAVGSFGGRSDDLINLRGIKMYPVQLEQAVRAVPGVGDEYEILIETDDAGVDMMTARVEHTDDISEQIVNEIKTRCEVTVGVEVLTPGTLPKTEFKAKRIRDERDKG
jgi:phenylacetate-CoA ligase